MVVHSRLPLSTPVSPFVPCHVPLSLQAPLFLNLKKYKGALAFRLPCHGFRMRASGEAGMGSWLTLPPDPCGGMDLNEAVQRSEVLHATHCFYSMNCRKCVGILRSLKDHLSSSGSNVFTVPGMVLLQFSHLLQSTKSTMCAPSLFLKSTADDKSPASLQCSCLCTTYVPSALRGQAVSQISSL